MPAYDYLCKECGAVEEECRLMSEMHEKGVCKGCGGKTEHIYTVSPTSTFAFRPRVFDHIAPQPIHISSQRELNKICKENDSHIVSDDRGKRTKYYDKRAKWEKKHMAKVGR